MDSQAERLKKAIDADELTASVASSTDGATTAMAEPAIPMPAMADEIIRAIDETASRFNMSGAKALFQILPLMFPPLTKSPSWNATINSFNAQQPDASAHASVDTSTSKENDNVEQPDASADASANKDNDTLETPDVSAEGSTNKNNDNVEKPDASADASTGNNLEDAEESAGSVNGPTKANQENLEEPTGVTVLRRQYERIDVKYDALIDNIKTQAADLKSFGMLPRNAGAKEDLEDRVTAIYGSGAHQQEQVLQGIPHGGRREVQLPSPPRCHVYLGSLKRYFSQGATALPPRRLQVPHDRPLP